MSAQVARARTAASLVHDNIVQVFDYESDGTREAYIAMEMVEGRSLPTLPDRQGPDSPMWWRRRLPLRWRAAWPMRTPRAWSIATLKPDRVLFSNLGAVKLGDFKPLRGSPRRRGSQRRTPRSGSPAVRPSPGATRGTPGGPTNDVFGLGVTLYEMAAGPFPLERQQPGDGAQWWRSAKFGAPGSSLP